MGQSEQIDNAIRQDMAREFTREEQLQSEITENGTLLNVAVEAKRLITEAREEDDLNEEECAAVEIDLKQLNQIIKNARHTHVGLLFAFMGLVTQAREKRASKIEPVRPVAQTSNPVEVDLNIKGRS